MSTTRMQGGRNSRKGGEPEEHRSRPFVVATAVGRFRAQTAPADVSRLDALESSRVRTRALAAALVDLRPRFCEVAWQTTPTT